MTRAHLLRFFALTALLMLAPAAAGGPIEWGYDWSATPTFVPGGPGKVTFSNEVYTTATNNSHVVAANLKVFSTASPQVPDSFGLAGGHYTLTVNLKDIDSGATGSLTFTGRLQGTISSHNALVTNTFTSPTTRSVLLGFTTFVVTMDSYTPPGPPDQGNLGSIGALVEVSSARPQEEGNSPEPSAMALAGLGAGIAGLTAWRRRRRAAAR
jgi:hypothetical protein